MTGEVVAMSQPILKNGWRAERRLKATKTMAAAGKDLFRRMDAAAVMAKAAWADRRRRPAYTRRRLRGLYGRSVTLQTGATVTADDKFIRDCILTPDKTPVAGYPPIMPSFSGQISEEEVLRLIAYIKSLKSGSRT